MVPLLLQVISDHVLRLDQLIHEDGGSVGFASASDDTSSSATSSGAESEDDTPRSGGPHHPQPNQHTQVDLNLLSLQFCYYYLLE